MAHHFNNIYQLWLKSLSSVLFIDIIIDGAIYLIFKQFTKLSIHLSSLFAYSSIYLLIYSIYDSL